jgi:hypothetical protein
MACKWWLCRLAYLHSLRKHRTMKRLSTFSLLLALASGAQAVAVYSLASDFSDAANPNGVWSFTQGVTPLPHFLPTGGNALNPALTNGFWGTGSDLNVSVPFVGKTTQAGGTLSGYNNGDFLSGQVIAHSANSGSSLFVNWTAPAAGTISFSASAWYAQTPVNRVNEVYVSLQGTPLSGPTTINNTSSETNRVLFAGTGLAVAPGDVLSFEIRKQAAQTFGSITGLDETVTFTATAVPESATMGLMLVGLAGVTAAARRRAVAGAR